MGTIQLGVEGCEFMLNRLIHLSKQPAGILLLASWFAILTLIALGPFYVLPAPRSGLAVDFDGKSARRVLESINFPHSTGSYGILRAQAILYEHVVDIVGNSTYMTIERADEYPNNLFVVMDGSTEKVGARPRNTFLVNAHYDSQVITPGAQDNGCGVVVVLEALRAIVASGQPKVPSIWLFNGDEESGFLGVEAF